MTIYGGAMLLLYILQTTPGFLELGGVKPLLVLPWAVSIAMMEGELVGGLFGLAAGLLCDVSGIMLFGINSTLYMAACVTVGLLVIYYMQPSLANSLLFTGAILLVRELFEFFFYYVMWGYEGSSQVFWGQMIPMFLLTLVVTPLFYWLVRRVYSVYRRKIND